MCGTVTATPKKRKYLMEIRNWSINPVPFNQCATELNCALSYTVQHKSHHDMTKA
jgi:hypothetical protein